MYTDGNEQMEYVCEKCGHILKEGQMFCSKCGTPRAVLVERKCSVCGTVLEDDDLFCPMCGKRYEDEPKAVAKIEQSSVVEEKPTELAVVEEIKPEDEIQKPEWFIEVDERSVAAAVFFSLITCGLYSIYWVYRIMKMQKELDGDGSSVLGEMLCMLFVPFYGIYWYYTRADKIIEGLEKRGIQASSNKETFLICGILCLAIVNIAIIQGDFNKLWEKQFKEKQEYDKKINAIKAERAAKQAPEKDRASLVD